MDFFEGLLKGMNCIRSHSRENGCVTLWISGAGLIVGAAFQPRSALPALKRFAAGKPLPQKYFKS
jgi:hypothetical protein